ncbi:RNA exonuclease 1 homolog [Bombina bombina]|uniref:RNA exonuclease 1 homolog n=1 Tax=Bombina bombina TaxID=8345 RepID=UPI00235B0C8B|nr:RNA exonuclease 1 homolog [Bombina bombina]
MLRSAGFFEQLECPFSRALDSSSTCQRPHCQFLHVFSRASEGEAGTEDEETANVSQPDATGPQEEDNVTSPETYWDASKAVLREEIKVYIDYDKNNRIQDVQLTNQLSNAYNAYVREASAINWQKYLRAKKEREIFLQQNATSEVVRTNARLYKFGAIGKKIQELEKINKAIEAVKNEVEEKQKKLSLYKHVTQDINKDIVPEIDSNSNLSYVDEDEQYSMVIKRTNLITNGNSSKISSNSTNSKKYVIDRRCPATDLEYDPLLNYSACVFGSSTKESENRSKRKYLNCDEDTVEETIKKARAVSPIRLEIKLQESDDDDVLIIDAPPLNETSKKQRVKRFIESEEKCKPFCEEVPENKDSINTTVENDFFEPGLVEKENAFVKENVPSVSLSSKICLLNNMDESIVDRPIKEINHNIELIELSHFSKGLDVPEPKETKPANKNEFSETCNENIQELMQLKEDLIPKYNDHISDLQEISAEQSSLKEKQKLLGSAQALESIANQMPTQVPAFDQCAVEASSLITNTTYEQKNNPETLTWEKENSVIVLDSASEQSEESEVDVDISDSDDPTEECLRIFNEFAESQANKNKTQSKSEVPCSPVHFNKEHLHPKWNGTPTLVSENNVLLEILHVDPHSKTYEMSPSHKRGREQKTTTPCQKSVLENHSEVDLSDTKGSDLVPGQKKRIAHSSAKCNTKNRSRSTVKSNSVLVPYREPAPQQIPHAKILQVQQQAVQITAAVKSGQAFVASTQRKFTGCISPAFHNFGQMVCFNLVELQPVVPNRSQFSGIIQGNTVATPLKSTLPQKRTIQTTPIKITSRKRTTGLDTGAKVPHDTRQRYVNSFVEEFLKDCTTVQEAFEKAQIEERAIYDRCGSKNMYLNIAVNSLKKLRDQRNMTPNSKSPKTKISMSGVRRQDEKKFSGINLFKMLKEYLLSDEQLKDYGYPRPNAEKPGSALLHNVVTKTIVSDALRRVCCRCGEIYSVTLQGRHVRMDECTYHSGKVLRHKVPGGMETRYNCCEAVVGTPGCQVAKLHVYDSQKENLDGFIKTFLKLQTSDGNPGAFSLDCKTCYTTHGLELTRVTVVDSTLQVIYDTFVKPDNEILDYNTRFSGVTEDNLTNITTSIRDVQAVILNLFSSDTILIGHELENNLIALKLIHDTVVDTSVVFPHRLGLPHRRSLRNLMADCLRRIIQDNVSGHDSVEDATACMELMLWKVKEDSKGRR